MIDRLTPQHFENLAPDALSVRHEGVEVPLSVVSVHALPHRSARAASFAVELQGPARPLLPQQIHPLRHPELGMLELFMVPIAQTATHSRYELIFN